MILTLDNLAHRYSILPNEALKRANTFDLFVLDVGAKYIKYQQDKENSGLLPNNKQPSQAQMVEMLKRVREQ